MTTPEFAAYASTMDLPSVGEGLPWEPPLVAADVSIDPDYPTALLLPPGWWAITVSVAVGSTASPDGVVTFDPAGCAFALLVGGTFPRCIPLAEGGSGTHGGSAIVPITAGGRLTIGASHAGNPGLSAYASVVGTVVGPLSEDMAAMLSD